MEELKIIVGKNLSALRKKNKLTQIELAEKFNYSDKAVSKWEQGATLPDIETLKQLCDFYGVTIDYLTNPENIKNPKDDPNRERVVLINHIIMSSLLSSIIWIIATIIFVYPIVFSGKADPYWPIFIWGLAANAILLWVLNISWFKKKILTLVAWTVFNWAILAATHLHFLFFTIGYYNVWMVYLIGAPIQAVIILWFILRIRKK